jgi:hypothetical protein
MASRIADAAIGASIELEEAVATRSHFRNVAPAATGPRLPLRLTDGQEEKPPQLAPTLRVAGAHVGEGTLRGVRPLWGAEGVFSLCAMSSIGVMREGPLHAAVKAFLARPGDRLEVPVGRYVIDLVRANGELVEVQTGGFTGLGKKLDALLDEHRVRIVHPVAAERRIVRVDDHGEVVSVRRSPKRATAVAVFDRLVAFPSLVTHPNLTIEVLLLREDHVRAARPFTSRRRTRDPGQRRPIDLLDRVEIRGPSDVLKLLPALPDEPFSTRELGVLLGCNLLLAQRTVFCLRTINLVEPAGKRGRTPLHRRTTEASLRGSIDNPMCREPA